MKNRSASVTAIRVDLEEPNDHLRVNIEAEDQEQFHVIRKTIPSNANNRTVDFLASVYEKYRLANDEIRDEGSSAGEFDSTESLKEERNTKQ